MFRIAPIIRITRPINCILAGTAVWIGAYLTYGYVFTFDIVLAALTAVGVVAAANIQNDILDIDADRIAHPERVLPLGHMQLKTATIAAAIMLGIGLAAAAFAGPSVALAACGATALLSFYNAYLKRIALVGNLAIGIAGGLPFVVGGLAVDWFATFVLPGPLIPASFALLFHVAREIVKDIQDIEGDRVSGIITFPMVVGTRAAAGTALLVIFLLDFLVLVSIQRGWFSSWYTLLAVAGVIVPISVLTALAASKPDTLRLKLCATGLKIGMVIGMVALVLGRQH